MNRPEGGIDRHRLDSASHRFQTLILEGIGRAYAESDELDQGTARLIAHALGRALGNDSKLAEFGRSGAGEYEELRDEYLQLYRDPTTPPMIKEWIDWLGTYLVANHADGTGRQFMGERTPPSLDRILVRTELTVQEQIYLMHAPATLTGTDYESLAARLEALNLPGRGDLQAFLTLRDVNAADPGLLESLGELLVGEYESIEAVLYALSELEEWEKDLRKFAEDRDIEGAVSIDHRAVETVLREIYDVVELKGRFYVFYP